MDNRGARTWVVVGLTLASSAALAQAVDAGRDAGPSADAAVADAGRADGGGGDAGRVDGGGADAAVADAAVADAAVADAGCGQVDALGECEGTLARRCVSGRLQTTDCERTWGRGSRCVLSPELGAAVCEYVTEDAGLTGLPLADGGSPSVTPTQGGDDGSTCVKPAWDVTGAIMVGGALTRRRRSRAQPPPR